MRDYEKELTSRITAIETQHIVLFKDYSRLAKSHQVSSDSVKDNMREISAVAKRLDECCSTDDLVERAVAHKDLAKVIDSLSRVISKLTIVETLSHSLAEETKARKQLHEDVSKLKLYGYMVAGAMVALEFTGALHKIKELFV